MSDPSLGDGQSLPPPPQRQHSNKTPTPPRRFQNSTPPNPFSPFSVTRQGVNLKSPRLGYSPAPFVRLLSNDPLLHRPRKTHPLVWCSAIMCLIFCLLVIFFGIVTLIVYLVIRPRYSTFDVPNANLNAIYFDSPENFNGDFTLLANFTNPNRKISIRYDYLDVELYFADRLIATQALEPFTQRPGERRLEMIHLISSLVYLPPYPAIELQRQVQINRVKYDIRGNFRVRARVGIIRFSYWLHTTCQLEMTSPPTGRLVARNCKTKR
ncbi:uncharacterized protein At1g08160 [Silene latifolia]|uniref:uncharacterized protein At1g08160 n=1 Tax=Silene latifolia TaxID=37657 RepID=UPI003D76A7DC